MPERRLFGIYISFQHGDAHIGVHPTLRDARDALEDEAAEHIPALKVIEHSLKAQGHFIHEFDNGTWAEIQEIPADRIEVICKAWGVV